MAADEVQDEAPQAARMGAAALLLASSVMLSRLLGYGREALLAYRVGAGASSDAYYAAFQIPDLLNYLLAGGALSVAFLPLYTRHLTRGDSAAAERLLATVLGTLSAVAALATAVLWWWAAPLIAVQFPRFDPPTQALTTHLTRIVLPAQVFFIAGGIINATLLARGRFGAAAAAPLLYNGGIIAGGLLLAPWLDLGVEGFAWGALIGAMAGPFAAPLLDARHRVRLRARFAPFDRAFLGYLAIAAPLMLGQSLLTVNEWYERWFGALMAAGTVAQLSYARRLMLVPVAVVGQAIAAAALPTLSRLWAEGRRAELDRLVLRTMQAGVALAVLIAAAFVALSREVVQATYQRGAFTEQDTVAVAAILSLLALAVPAWISQQIITRAFFARGDTWRPMVLSTAVALGAIPLYMVFGQRFGVRGLATAGTISMTVNALATIGLARWLHGGPALRPLCGTALRAAAIGLPAGVAATLALPYPAASGLSAVLLNAAVGGAAFAAVTALGIALLGDAPMRDLARGLMRRLRPRLK